MKHKRLLSLLLTLAMALALAAPAFGYNADSLVPQKKNYSTAFTDTKGTWCDGYVRTCYEAGLLDGTTKTTFSPNAPLTYAQITVICARLHSLLHGGDGQMPAAKSGQAWYRPAADYLMQHISEETDAGIYLLMDLLYLDQFANNSCDRYDFVWYLSAVLDGTAMKDINSTRLLPDVTDPDVLKFYRAGILTGSNAYGTFNGLETLNRGQAAAMLARIVDPSQRVKFTPKSIELCQELLGLDRNAAVMTIDGFDVSSELYVYCLSRNIAYMELESQYSYYEQYPTYFAEYLETDEYGSFAQYLLETYGLQIDTKVDWNTPDRGGMTPAQKVLANTLEDLKQFAALQNHGAEYPLTGRQQAMILQTLYPVYGYSNILVRQIMEAQALQENLTAKQNPSPTQLRQYLEDAGYIYGQCAVFYRNEGTDDATLKQEAEELRQKISSHAGESDYVEYLILRYSYSSGMPVLISLNDLSSSNATSLKNLSAGKVSQVLTEADEYLVVLKLDPSQDEDLGEFTGLLLAEAQLDQWAKNAQVTTSDAYNTIDVARIAAKLDEIGM